MTPAALTTWLMLPALIGSAALQVWLARRGAVAPVLAIVALQAGWTVLVSMGLWRERRVLLWAVALSLLLLAANFAGVAYDAAVRHS